MSHRTTAIALAFGLALASGGPAWAQSTPAPDAPATPPPAMQKMLDETGLSSITLREAAAIGTGVIVGAALWHVVIGHSFALAGAAIGGWIGDWCYGMHAAPTLTRTGT
jgi:hypothetical protein